MPSELNFWRQLDVFNPPDFKRTVHIVGCGAIGSHVCETLIRSGISDIHVYDMDVVDGHNIPNQAFYPDQVGMKKVDAMAKIASRLSATVIPHDQEVTRVEINSPSYLIMAVDSMSARRAIFETSAKYNPNVRMIEARMAAEYGIIHCIDPTLPDDITYWMSKWVPDDKAEESPCTNRAIATTAKLLSAAMVHHLISWETGIKPAKQSFCSLRPFMVETVDK